MALEWVGRWDELSRLAAENGWTKRRWSSEQVDEFVRAAHAGQADKAGVDYWQHPLAVASKMREAFPDYTHDEDDVAKCHDVLEDTGVTEEGILRAGMSLEGLRVLLWVTKGGRPGFRGITYMQWMQAISLGDTGLAADDSPVRVKLCDNWHNSLPSRIASLPPEKRDIGEKRYAPARRILLASPHIDPVARVIFE